MNEWIEATIKPDHEKEVLGYIQRKSELVLVSFLGNNYYDSEMYSVDIDCWQEIQKPKIVNNKLVVN